MLKKNGRNCCE